MGVPFGDYLGSSGPQDRRATTNAPLAAAQGPLALAVQQHSRVQQPRRCKGGSRLRPAAGFARSLPIGTPRGSTTGGWGVAVDLSRDTCTVTRKASRKLISLDDF